MKAALDTTSVLQNANLTEAKVCMNDKFSCVVFEHFCGPHKLWNLEEMLKFFMEYWETTRPLVTNILRGENIKLFLSVIQPYCPHSSKYCKKEFRGKRSQPKLDINSSEVTDFVSGEGLRRTRRKRAFDPLQMMGMFNKMLCNQEIAVAIAEYYQKHYKTLEHNRVWPIKNISPIWCCLVEIMEELYRQTPDN